MLPICDIPTNEIGIYNTVKRYLASYPHVSSIFYATSLNSGGIIAIQEAGLQNKVRIITLDMNDFIIEGLKNGSISASISQNPYVTGYNAAKIVFNKLLGSKNNPDLTKIKCDIIIHVNLI